MISHLCEQAEQIWSPLCAGLVVQARCWKPILHTHTHRGKHSYKPGEPYQSTSCIPLHSKTASVWGRNGCQLFHMWLCWWCNPQWQPPLHPHPPMPSPTLPMLEPNACYTHKQNFPSVVKYQTSFKPLLDLGWDQRQQDEHTRIQ
jgi:hypothetical protein